MASVNKVILIGIVERHPESRTLRDGSSVCQLNLITSESWRDKATGIQSSRTERHRVQLYRQQADVALRYLNAGSEVYIEGRIHTRSWLDNQGQTRYITEIQAQNMTMLGGKPGHTTRAEAPLQTMKPANPAPVVVPAVPEKDPWEDAPEADDPFPF